LFVWRVWLYVRPFFYSIIKVFYKIIKEKFVNNKYLFNFTPSNNTDMLKFTLLIWYRYTRYGEQQKECDLFTIEALGVHDAFKKIKKRDFPDNRRIPTDYAINVEPVQWYKSTWLISCVKPEHVNNPISD
jgi:hypothetical protein